ncbi:MAG TPA: hypothetical protein VHJ18_23980 [Streptosporangiaceae bacterium]|jgi:hypothetical protein|nr:hypothetical protein [Streptosporangiaceae bacterium]
MAHEGRATAESGDVVSAVMYNSAHRGHASSRRANMTDVTFAPRTVYGLIYPEVSVHGRPGKV